MEKFIQWQKKKSHNTARLDVEGTVQKILTTDYVREELDGIRHN